MIEYDGNFFELQQKFGKRPGDYTVDPYFFRKGIAGKPYFWDESSRKWTLVRPNDLFDFDEYGNVVRVDA